MRHEYMIQIEDYDKLVYVQETTQQCAEEMSQPYTYIEEVNFGAQGRVRSHSKTARVQSPCSFLLLFIIEPCLIELQRRVAILCMCPCGFTIAIVSPWQQIAKIQDANGQLRALKTIATKVERLVHPTSCGAEAAVLQDIKSKKLEHLTHPAVYEVLETDRFTQVVTDFYPCDTVELVVAHKEAHGTPLPAETAMYVAVSLAGRQRWAGRVCCMLTVPPMPCRLQRHGGAVASRRGVQPRARPCSSVCGRRIG
jgi:hypothetical protein